MLEVVIKKSLENFTLDVAFKVNRGIVGILGPSGCGKSLTLQAIAGLLDPDYGKIVVGGRSLFDHEQKINIPTRKRKVGYVFQNYALFPHLTVSENIGYGLQSLSKKERDKKIATILETVQLSGLESRYPNQLSGGQQQRVALARTLITEPDILLLDEPFSALDQHVKKVLELELLEIIKHNFSGVVLFVTHNIEEAYRLCDYICLYENGTTIQFDKKEEVLQRPVNKAAARIVGCENILQIETINDSYVAVNGLKLHLDSRLKSKKSYVGIHSYDATFITKEAKTNSFQYEIVSIVESIDHTLVSVAVNDVLFKVSVAKSQIKDITNPVSRLYLPPEKLFLME